MKKFKLLFFALIIFEYLNINHLYASESNNEDIERIDEIVYINGNNHPQATVLGCREPNDKYISRYDYESCKYRRRRKSLTTAGEGSTLTLIAYGASASTGRILGGEGAIDIVQ